MQNQALNMDTAGLHISYSQIFTYLTCSLKYRFRYVLKKAPERIGVSLPFGTAMHRALEFYYRAFGDGRIAKLSILQELFEEDLTSALDEKQDLIVYGKVMADKDSAIVTGRAMLKAFYESIDLTGWWFVDVELPLAARLFTEDGKPTDYELVGFVDLVMRDPQGDLVVIDHKTAARAKVQADVDADLQMSVYAYLLAANRYIFPTATVQCRYDVLRKLKTPKLEHYHTTRSAADRKRLVKIAVQVLRGIEAGVFVPNRSWMCTDCEYGQACKSW